MIHAVAIFFVLFVVLVLTAVVFTIWLFTNVIKLVGRLTGVAGGGRRRLSTSSTVCGNHLCRAALPPNARYCRRCGVPRMVAARPVVTARRQVARMRMSA